MVRDITQLRQAAARDPFRRGLVIVPAPLLVAASVVANGGFALLLFVDYAGTRIAAFLLLGIAIGVATCIPIGVANVLVIDAACRHGRARAIGAGVGGALADGVYASVGIFGLGPLLARHPAIPRVLHVISGCVLLAYGVVLLRSRPTFIAADGEMATRGERELSRGIATGIVATLLNPSAIVTWVVIVGAQSAGVGATAGCAWVAGIVIGTLAWFLVVAALALRGRRLMQANALWTTRTVAALLIGSGAVAVARIALGG